MPRARCIAKKHALVARSALARPTYEEDLSLDRACTKDQRDPRELGQAYVDEHVKSDVCTGIQGYCWGVMSRGALYLEDGTAYREKIQIQNLT